MWRLIEFAWFKNGPLFFLHIDPQWANPFERYHLSRWKDIPESGGYGWVQQRCNKCDRTKVLWYM